MESDMDWERPMIKSLKAAKLYLKGDYKVCLKQTKKLTVNELVHLEYY